ncbi:hypothetical protein PR048_013688 [Dryococelus australis]|uniref:Reverse transcriptase RNase H-like domain-containing protein n=1 Tax=Dryococelus australis TaxID=614101 RepID=A0ABQ9HSW7_9NEOP|nr:hypothetical protein PR048_013688 [Dryococelus australis]
MRQSVSLQHGLGTILYQLSDDGSKRFVDYSSITFSTVEHHYDVNKIECLAVVWSVKQYKQFMEYQRFTLTDNRFLVWLHNTKEACSKLKCWALFLQLFDFEVQHVPGAENQLTDVLSRSPGETVTQDKEMWEAILLPSPPELSTITNNAVVRAQLTATSLNPTLTDFYACVIQAQQPCPVT